MVRIKKISVAFVALLALAVAPRTAAQGGAPPAPALDRASQEQQQQTQAGADQLELMRALNLTPEQRALIAKIRRETEEQTRLDNVRVRRARRALEEAIYAETADESLIETRSREVAEAEAARARTRAGAELKVRRVLKPEQLGTFRELRRQAMLSQRRERQNALGDLSASILLTHPPFFSHHNSAQSAVRTPVSRFPRSRGQHTG
ncbi:MAG: Spy/CpxP family protein refolding chaperone [Acidobacteria bacterium]|nr:Spy/CpxP family protein refolding chaperone [Acidobacteriota bacterium]